MALITETSNPTLWAALNSMYQENPKAAYIQRNTTCYTVHQTTDGDIAFVERDNQELFDSRSLIGSRPASYSKLDGTT